MNSSGKPQKGGERIVPLYNEEKFNPFATKEEQPTQATYPDRNDTGPIYHPRQPDLFPPTQGQQAQKGSQSQPLVNLQVYQPAKPKEPMKTAQPTLFYPPTVPTPFAPPQYQLPGFMMGTGLSRPVQVPIVNTYNINNGPTVDHGKLNMVYEDILPLNQLSGNISTLSERLNIHNFIRSMMFSKGDGQNVGLEGQNEDTLLSHLKLMDLNPYNTYKFANNPYKGLPTGFLIYKSCYPIKHDPVATTVICSRNSIGANIRIYKLTEGSYSANSQNGGNINEFNEWREKSYYEYVRKHILEEKQSPNFVIYYGYYISHSSNIDFDRIAQIRGITTQSQPEYIVSNSSVSVSATVPPVPGLNTQPTRSRQAVASSGPAVPDFMNSFPQYRRPTLNALPNGSELVVNPEAYTGKAIVAMTEAPNYNLLGWASKTYQMDGNIKRQITTGFHLNKVWFSIIFQMTVAMYGLQIHQIVFNNFSVENNIYIKEITKSGVATQYWKYKIDGIDYYIPNYGYILLVDTNYSDVNPPGKKIYGAMFSDSMNFKAESFKAFKKAIDPNVFDQTFMNYGGCKPPQDVLALLGTMHSEASNDTNYEIGKYIYKYFGRFLSNRVGTYLKELEVPNIRKDEKNWVKGQILVHEDSNYYRFVMFVENNGGQVKILTKNNTTDNDIIEKTVHVGALYGYSKMESIVQTYKPNESNLDENDLLETYTMSKN